MTTHCAPWRTAAAAMLLAWGLAGPALAGVPTLQPVTEEGVTVSAPADWKSLITADEHNLVMSRDAATSINLHWYPHKKGTSLDKMLDKLLEVTNANLPMGSATEQRRRDLSGADGKVMTATYSTFGYEMTMGFIALDAEAEGHIITAILLTDPASYDDLDGEALLDAVATSLQAPRREATPRPAPAPGDGATPPEDDGADE